MKIKVIVSQMRRDFYAIYKCEHCGHETIKEPGYDDDNFHRNVIPKMECSKCNKTADNSYRPLGTKYAESIVV